MEGYSAKIKEVSVDLSAKQRIQLKDTTTAIKLDSATQEGELHITPDFHAILEIHNDKSDNQDYEVFVLVDKDGSKYVTGSNSFKSAYMDIYNEMKDETEEWGIRVYRMPSKNYAGRDFLTCSVE